MKRAGLVALAMAGCAMDFDPPSLLLATEPRVLAIEVEPLQAGPGETVTLTPRVFVPEGLAAPAMTWRFCPLTAGPAAAYRCAIPACETAIEPESDGRVRADVTQLALACVEALADGEPDAGVAPMELPDEVEMIFTLELSTLAGPRAVVARLPYFPRGVPEPRNRAPVIGEVRIAGVAASTTAPAAPAARGSTVDVEVDTVVSSLDEFTDPSGRARTESPFVSFYSTAGRFDADRGAGLTAKSALELGEGTEARIYVVLRDGRGGQAVRGPYVLPVAP